MVFGRVSSTCEQCGQWPTRASRGFAGPALDWEVSGRAKESWLIPGTISHLPFQSSFVLHHFPLRERKGAAEMAQSGLAVIALVLEREPMDTSGREDQTHQC